MKLALNGFGIFNEREVEGVPRLVVKLTHSELIESIKNIYWFGTFSGIVVTIVMNELDLMDVNIGGQKDSIGDVIKIGTKELTDSVSSLFK